MGHGECGACRDCGATTYPDDCHYCPDCEGMRAEALILWCYVPCPVCGSRRGAAEWIVSRDKTATVVLDCRDCGAVCSEDVHRCPDSRGAR